MKGCELVGCYFLKNPLLKSICTVSYDVLLIQIFERKTFMFILKHIVFVDVGLFAGGAKDSQQTGRTTFQKEATQG